MLAPTAGSSWAWGGTQRAVAMEKAYADLGLWYVDATVITTCELLEEDRVVTLDRRHFGAVRPGHRPFLDLLPH